jgi:cation transport regulator ChaB
MPIEILKKLPKKARTIWESAFKLSKEKYGAERAAQIAWAAVKKKYKKEDDKWIARSESFIATSQEILCRSELGDTSNDYFVEGVLATTMPQSDGKKLTQELLTEIVDDFKNTNYSPKADIDHIGTLKERGYKVTVPETDENIMRFVDMDVRLLDDGSYGLYGKAQLDRTVKNFERIWYKLQNKFYDSFSIEIYPKAGMKKMVRTNDGKLIEEWYGGTLKKATITGQPVDRKATITKVEKR